jgi:hypothetical protein
MEKLTVIDKDEFEFLTEQGARGYAPSGDEIRAIPLLRCNTARRSKGTSVRGAASCRQFP